MLSKITPPKHLFFPIILALIVVNLLCLSVLLRWRLRWSKIHAVNTQAISKLDRYQHPQIPIVSAPSDISLTATSFILIDNNTNTTLISKNPDQKIFPASTTKLATALTALNIYPLDELITIKEKYDVGKVMNLVPEEKITVKSLVTALLVYSANDAAYSLANHHQAGVGGFVNQMNLIVSKYGLKNTHFANYDGIDDPENYSSVYDLAQIGRISIKNPVIREVVRNKAITVTDISGSIKHELISTNELLGLSPEIEGLKTGWTPEAGGSFVGLINRNGHYLISVVANSTDRFSDTQKIVDWAKENVVWNDYLF
ncbi:MAG: serine hydrolase [Candidatus Shapirobacteria bacterium]|jgi:D-alanyl-D-alanine carboxypeptidase